ncbi:MAG: GGDEF domain-containing protein [Alteromonadaceae bacterium]|nr:GGDEF domain-containing protein [Alteromonadaceae bacterium]
MESGFVTVDGRKHQGGDEFVVILSPCDRATLQQIACRIRADVEKESRHTGMPVTISVGACYCLPGEDMDTILGKTDKALYEAKHRGRNRVCIHTENGPVVHPV